MGLQEIQWTPEGLEKIVRNWLHWASEPDPSCRFCEYNEAGYDWNVGALHYSTEVNGTHHWIKNIKAADAKKGATSIAKELFEKSEDFPGWRCLSVDISAHRILVQIHGGKRV